VAVVELDVVRGFLVRGLDKVEDGPLDAGLVALRCRLLYEIEVAAAAGLELSVQMLGCAQLEACAVGLYVHAGGWEALLRVAQGARHSLEGPDLEAKQFDDRLAAEKSAARKSGKNPGYMPRRPVLLIVTARRPR
jgi:hypothetical protein